VPAELIPVRTRTSDGEVNFPSLEKIGDFVTGALAEIELNPGRFAAESAQQVRNQPAGHRAHKRQSHGAAVGIA